MGIAMSTINNCTAFSNRSVVAVHRKFGTEAHERSMR